METNFLKLYLDANKTLAKTLVVKSQASIDSINDYLKLQFGTAAVDLYDPTSWKYYRHIAGEYHPTDESMTITSLDTLESIVFSKATLAVHVETAKAYSYGTRYYYSLLDQYPEQEQLILGILYPCDIQVAIDAEDGSILSYPKSLVEPQELTLITELEGYIKRYLIRWHVKAFGLSDTLYNTAQMAVMYLNILPRLLNLRLNRCHTNEVHSFHIREYLASHGRLDRYLPYLTLKQALYLYRNIRYIERNSGKVEQFKELVDHILTERRIPLNEFTVRQLASFDDQYYSDINIRRKAVNPQFNVPEKTYFDTTELFDKEAPLVYNNPSYLDQYDLKIVKTLQASSSSVLQSKDLESSMVDYGDMVPDTLESVLLHTWAHLANKGIYTAVINFKDPKTLRDYQLSVEDAYIYMLYVSCQSIGLNIDILPYVINIKQRRIELPSIQQLTAITPDRYALSSVAQRLLSGQPSIGLVQSVNGFFNLGHAIYEEALYHWYLLSNTHHLEIRGYIQGMIHQLYEVEYLTLTSGTMPMNQWLFNHNLPEYSYDTAQANELIKVLFKTATGLNTDNTKLLSNIQKALVGVLKELSSYSVQFITEINQSKIIPAYWAAIRVGRSYGALAHQPYVEANVRVIETHGQSDHSVTMDIALLNDTVTQVLESAIFVDMGVVNTEVQRISHTCEFYFAPYQITVDNQFDTVMLGYDHYSTLTVEQLNLLTQLNP